MLYGLTQRPVDEQLMEFLAVDEHLVDIGDDLVDYEASASFCIRYLAESVIHQNWHLSGHLNPMLVLYIASGGGSQC